MRFTICFRVLFISIIICTAGLNVISGQGNTNNTGNGGINSIRGRIYLPNGRTLERAVKVEIQSVSQPTQSVYTDSNGAFVFTGLSAGSYTVVVDAGEDFEIAREYFLIDNEVQLSDVRLPPVPKILTTPVYLRFKRTETLVNEVLNAKWSAIPRDAVQHFKRGIEFLQSGKEDEAEAEFRSSVTIAPNFAPAHTAIGNLELKAGKLGPAVDSFKMAVRYDSTDFDANLNLGIAYLNQKKFDEAESAFVTAAYLNRFAVTPHYYLGLLFSTRNDADVAQKAFERVKELGGGNGLPVIHKYLGRIYMHKQMKKEAVTEFETYLSLVPAAKDAEAIRRDIAEIKSRQK